MAELQPTDPYDAPKYWDLAFSDETVPEADFLEAVAAKYLGSPLRRILEPACGGGRQVMELARRGFHVTGFDLNDTCVRFVRRRLGRSKSSANIVQADMVAFTMEQLGGVQRAGESDADPGGTRFDLAHCLVNSFRHLITEHEAVSHLNSVASVLREGGLYVLGFHLLPPDAAEDDCERWTICQRDLRVTTTVRVLEFHRRQRRELVRFSLRVRSPKIDLKLRTDHWLRIYRADQILRLLKKVPAFKLLDVFDFCYETDQPLPLNDDLGDTVLILRRV